MSVPMFDQSWPTDAAELLRSDASTLSARALVIGWLEDADFEANAVGVVLALLFVGERLRLVAEAIDQASE